MPLEGVQRTGDSREGPFCAREVGGQCAAHMGEPEAEGQRRVAPRHPAARPLLPGVQAATRDRLRPATAHLVRGQRREGAVRRVRALAPRHCAKLYPLRGARGRRHAYQRGRGGTMQA